jgi:hypothetical protein
MLHEFPKQFEGFGSLSLSREPRACAKSIGCEPLVHLGILGQGRKLLDELSRLGAIDNQAAP